MGSWFDPYEISRELFPGFAELRRKAERSRRNGGPPRAKGRSSGAGLPSPAAAFAYHEAARPDESWHGQPIFDHFELLSEEELGRLLPMLEELRNGPAVPGFFGL